MFLFPGLISAHGRQSWVFWLNIRFVNFFHQHFLVAPKKCFISMRIFLPRKNFQQLESVQTPSRVFCYDDRSQIPLTIQCPQFCILITFSLSLSLSHTHMLTHSHIHTHRRTLSHTCTFTHAHIHIHKHSHTLTHTYSHTQAHSQIPTPKHIHTLTHTLRHTLSHPRFLSVMSHIFNFYVSHLEVEHERFLS